MILPAITQTVTRYCLQYMKIAGITGKKDRVGGGFLPPPSLSPDSSKYLMKARTARIRS